MWIQESGDGTAGSLLWHYTARPAKSNLACGRPKPPQDARVVSLHMPNAPVCQRCQAIAAQIPAPARAPAPNSPRRGGLPFIAWALQGGVHHYRSAPKTGRFVCTLAVGPKAKAVEVAHDGPVCLVCLSVALLGSKSGVILGEREMSLCRWREFDGRWHLDPGGTSRTFGCGARKG